MQVKGFEKTSLVDWDGKIVSVIFLPLCNFRCGFCHGASLVSGWQELPDVAITDIMDFLVNKKGWIDGVCITGGEPTLHKNGLRKLLKRIKNLGFLTKLDTNGTTSDFIDQLIKERLVDYIAMDIKASRDKYEEAVRAKVDLDEIDKTIKLLLKNKVDYEFRTTVVPGIIDEREIKKIGKWIKGVKRYALQQFRPVDTLDKKFLKVKPYHKEKLEEFANLLKGKVKECKIRGV